MGTGGRRVSAEEGEEERQGRADRLEETCGGTECKEEETSTNEVGDPVELADDGDADNDAADEHEGEDGELWRAKQAVSELVTFGKRL
jgi:hypothetical protein